MSGNTKFLGFGIDNTVGLERWGETAYTQLSEESVGAMKEVCYAQLPKAPPETKAPSHIRFNKGTGMIEFGIDIESELDVKQALNLLNDSLYAPDAPGDKVAAWIEELEGAIKQRKAYFSTAGEPGVDGDGEVRDP